MASVKIPCELGRDGKLKVLNRQLLDAVVAGMKPGRRYNMIIQGHRDSTISDPLRRYYWAVVATAIAEETGHSKEMIHDALKIKILAYKDERTGLPIVPSVFSDGSTLTVQEKRAFVDEVRRWAFDFLSLVIPDPETVVM
jgi:hypothetical protein